MSQLPVSSRGERGASLGLIASNSAELIQQVERGFSFKTLHTLESRSGLPGAALAGLARRGPIPGVQALVGACEAGQQEFKFREC